MPCPRQISKASPRRASSFARPIVPRQHARRVAPLCSPDDRLLQGPARQLARPPATPCTARSDAFEFPQCPRVQRQRGFAVIALHILRFACAPGRQRTARPPGYASGRSKGEGDAAVVPRADLTGDRHEQREPRLGRLRQRLPGPRHVRRPPRHGHHDPVYAKVFSRSGSRRSGRARWGAATHRAWP